MAEALTPEAYALLEAISGPESKGKWNVIYGGQRFNDYSAHPRTYVTIKSGPNKGQTSSAAGKYQILASTYDRVAPKLGITDFSPESQQRIAWYLAQEKYGPNLQADLESGDRTTLGKVANRLATIWTSLPSGIEAGTNTSKFVAAFNRAKDHPVPSVDVADATAPIPRPRVEREIAKNNASPGLQQLPDVLSAYAQQPDRTTVNDPQLAAVVAALGGMKRADMSAIPGSPGGFDALTGDKPFPMVPIPPKVNGADLYAGIFGSSKPPVAGLTKVVPAKPAAQALGRTIAQIGQEADNARLSGYRSVQEMGPSSKGAPPIKPAPRPRIPREYIGGVGGAGIAGQVLLPHDIVPKAATTAMEQAKAATFVKPPVPGLIRLVAPEKEPSLAQTGNLRGTNRIPGMAQYIPQAVNPAGQPIAPPAPQMVAPLPRPPAKIPLGTVAKIPQRIEHTPLGYAVGNWWNRTPIGRIGNFITGTPQAPLFGDGLFGSLFGGMLSGNSPQAPRTAAGVPIPSPGPVIGNAVYGRTTSGGVGSYGSSPGQITAGLKPGERRYDPETNAWGLKK